MSGALAVTGTQPPPAVSRVLQRLEALFSIAGGPAWKATGESGSGARPAPGRQVKYQCSMSKLDRGCPTLAGRNPAILVL